ncbi:MAG: hypothetical protein V4678_00630 [Patescibacteria group bacterium]
MSELKSVETSAIEGAFDSRIIEILFAMDHYEDVKGIYIGAVKSKSEEHDSSIVDQRINRFMDELGEKGPSWSRQYLGGKARGFSGESPIEFSEADMRNFELNGLTAGRFITRTVYDMLPIEWSTEGDSRVVLDFVITPEYVVRLTGNGTYDTAYLYDHEGADLDDDEPTDSEVLYEMEFTADLYHVGR